MLFLTREECATWRATHAPRASVVRDVGHKQSIATMPGDLANLKARKLAPLARDLVMWLVPEGHAAVLVWIREYGIWGSSEMLDLYGDWRRAHGNGDGLRENNMGLDIRPGHVFSREERLDIASLLVMSLVSGWGFVALAQGSNRAVVADHDGHLAVTSESADAGDDARRLCARHAKDA